jgi:8-oxo-dGTP diphosphatase
MEQIKLINLENVTDNEASEYYFREASRAAVFDENNLLGVIYSAEKYYYTLPGGGVEKNEDFETAVKREIKEEIGCNIEVVKKIGFITEYRKKRNLRQVSYCYLAKVIGEKGAPDLTPDEISEGYKTVWLSIEEAIKKISESNAPFYSWQYVKIRDISFLEAVSNHLKNNTI